LMDLTGPVALAAGIGVVGGGLLRGRKLSELVGSGVSLAVASVPEGLPLLATAAQLAAAQRLAERGALVRNGRSIEALGRVDAVCLDKTGTVTEGRVVLFMVCDCQQRELTGNITRSRRHVLATALRASRIDSGDEVLEPTDAALKAAADSNIIAPEFGCNGYQRRSEISYESGRGYHATLGVRRDANGRLSQVMSVKGAPEVVLPMCSVAAWSEEAEGDSFRRLDEALRAEIEQTIAQFADAGLRVLGVAERSIDVGDGQDEFDFQPASLGRLVWRGLLVFSDPVRPSARAAVRGLNDAGVRTIMITGDHPSTARAVAEELELPGSRKVLTGAELSDMDDAELDSRINSVGVFARITPAQKVRVVRALQRSGAVVAMVGDGANDAPAIRLADVGIAVGANCTAAARAAADIVLIDGSIETLVLAVVEGRAMWASVREAVSILLGGNFGEIAFTAAVGLLSGRPPLSARQLLLVNLLTDVAPAMAIALRAPSPDTLANLTQEGPEKSLGQSLDREIVERATLTAAGASAAWLTTRAMLGSHERAATVALAALVGTQLGQTLRAGYGSKTVLATGIGSAALLAAVIQTPGVSQFFGCRPLGPISWLTVATTSLGAANFPSFWQLLKEYVESREKRATQVTQVHAVLRPERSLNPPAATQPNHGVS
jgi:magnesium-transporting ATPase (P-type)